MRQEDDGPNAPLTAPPCGDDQSWEMISVFFHVPVDAFQEQKLEDSVGPKTVADDWNLVDGECHTLASYAAGREEGVDIFLRSWNAPLPPAILEEQGSLTHEAFLRGLMMALDGPEDTKLGYVVVASCLFDPTACRIPILADPPEVQDVSPTLGNVSVTGITLDFKNSEVGLRRVALENLEGRASMKSMFQGSLTLGNLPNVYDDVIRRVNEFSDLFVVSA